MSSIRFLAITILFAPLLPLKAAGTCNDVLQRNRAFSTIIKESTQSADEQLFEWLKTATWAEFSQKQNAGLSVALCIDGVQVGADGKYSQEQFQKFTEMRDQGKLRFFTEQELYKTVQMTASEPIAKAWSNCVKGPAWNPPPLTCWIDLDHKQENGLPVYQLVFVDEVSPRLPIAAVGVFTITGTRIVDRVNPLQSGSIVCSGPHFLDRKVPLP